MLRKKIFLMLFLFNFFVFIYIESVDADVVTNANACANDSGSIELKSENCESVGSDAGVVEEVKEYIESEDCTNVNYDVVVLLDISESMILNKGSDSYTRLKNLTNAYNSMIDSLKKSSKDGNNYRIRTCTFADSIECDGSFVEISKASKKNYNSLETKSESTYGTYIQGALIKGYQLLKNTPSGRTPLLVLITDGGPTFANNKSSVDTSVGDSTKGSSKPTFRLGNANFPKYAYYTVGTFKNVATSLVNKYSNAMILTFGIGDTSNTQKFILNPSNTTLNGIKGSEIYKAVTGQSLLQAYIKDWSGTFGTIVGSYSTVNNGTKKKPNYVYKLSFSIPTDASTSKVTSNDSEGLRAFIKNRKVNKIVFKDSKGNTTTLCDSWTKCKKLKDNAGASKHPYGARTDRDDNWNVFKINSVCKSSNGYCKGGKFVFYMKKAYENDTFSAINLSNMPTSKNLQSFTYKDATAFQKDFSNIIENAVCTSKAGYEVLTKKYNNCSDSTFIYDDEVYLKNDNNEYYNDPAQKNKAGSCIKVSNATVKYILTESINFNIGSFSPTTVYAGGSFSWNSSSLLTNKVNWYYNNISNDTPVFSNVSLEAYDKTGEVVTEEFVSLDRLYSDANCTATISKENLNNKILNKVSNSDTKDISESVKESFKTIDTDSPDIDDAWLDNVTSVEKSVDSASNTVNYKYSSNLLYACISNNGQDISYMDNENCDSNYISGGQNRYIPLKYNKNTFSVNAYGNYSVIDGHNVDVDVSCPMKVKKGLYECTDGDFPCDEDDDKLKVAYDYRSISVDNPFPKADSKDEVAENWQDWYCGNDSTCSSSNANMQRIKNTYINNEIFYSVNFSRGGYSDVDYIYTSWDSITKDGTSDFINVNPGSELFTKVTNSSSYCKLGKFDSSGCGK